MKPSTIFILLGLVTVATFLSIIAAQDREWFLLLLLSSFFFFFADHCSSFHRFPLACPRGKSCSYTNQGGDCSLGDSCTFNCTNTSCQSSTMLCGSGECSVVCTNGDSCHYMHVVGGSGTLDVVCDGEFVCLRANITGSCSQSSVICAQSFGCYQATFLHLRPPLLPRQLPPPP